MRVSVLVLVPALVVALAAPAAAQAPEVTINPTPTALKPGDTLTVSGLTDCPNVAYTVTLTVTDPEGNDLDVTATGTTDAEGEFVQPVTVPDNAVARDPASVVASVACGQEPTGSNAVNLQIDPHLGALTPDPDEGRPGTEVAISGTSCWGGEVEVIFGDGFEFDYAVAVPDVTVAADKTFSGTFTVPEVDAGDYVFAAGCPGSEYEFAPFAVLDHVVGPPLVVVVPPAAPPAVPVPGTPTFTG